MKIAILLYNLKLMQGMICHTRYKVNSKRLYGTRVFIILIIALQDFVVLYRKYHKIDKPTIEEDESTED